MYRASVRSVCVSHSSGAFPIDENIRTGSDKWTRRTGVMACVRVSEPCLCWHIITARQLMSMRGAVSVIEPAALIDMFPLPSYLTKLPSGHTVDLASGFDSTGPSFAL